MGRRCATRCLFRPGRVDDLFFQEKEEERLMKHSGTQWEETSDAIKAKRDALTQQGLQLFSDVYMTFFFSTF